MMKIVVNIDKSNDLIKPYYWCLKCRFPKDDVEFILDSGFESSPENAWKVASASYKKYSKK